MEAENDKSPSQEQPKPEDQEQPIEPQSQPPQESQPNNQESPDDQDQEDPNNKNSQQAAPERKKKSVRKNEISNFISKTYRILDDKQNNDIISWTDNGHSFIVKNKELFESTILPKYFKHSKFSSFVRQLNMYDFHKLRKQKEIPIFRHKYFKYNRKDLLKRIRRKCVAEDGAQQNNDQDFNQFPVEDVEPYGTREAGKNDGAQNKSQDFGSYASATFINPTENFIPISKHNIIEEESEENSSSEDSSSSQLLNSSQGQLQIVVKENQELSREVQNLHAQYLQSQDVRNRQREKLLKITSCLLYEDLTMTAEDSNSFGQPSMIPVPRDLRKLAAHFTNVEEESLGVAEYMRSLGNIFQKACSRLMQNQV